MGKRVVYTFIMFRPGATTIDAVTANACALFLVVVVAAIVGPAHRAAERRYEIRVDDVRNIMEAVLEMQTVDPARVDAIREAAEATGAPPRVMFGNGASCSGDFGGQCSVAITADDCLDATEFAGAYLPSVPVDPSGDYSSSATGYYIDFSPGVLEIGACNPETRGEVRLERTFF